MIKTHISREDNQSSTNFNLDKLAVGISSKDKNIIIHLTGQIGASIRDIDDEVSKDKFLNDLHDAIDHFNEDPVHNRGCVSSVIDSLKKLNKRCIEFKLSEKRNSNSVDAESSSIRIDMESCFYKRGGCKHRKGKGKANPFVITKGERLDQRSGYR